MCLFSTHTKNAKIKKRIAQLKNELVPMSRLSSHSNSFENISDIFDTWKQKGQHALYHFNEHVTELKKKVKENPKTTLALAAGLALAGFLLVRKN
ncbi:hypothetical protein BHOIPH791_09500 [Bartonella henselae]|uniref:Uncharacterized protein n=3 Tax=Bartonella TaxID=773 RepID=X5M6B5_BARHN|nr:hypothetical protein [Bartonella henselae]ATP12951.1 hypothetical protein BhenCHDE101_07940 [Bartonella henselae]ETS04956.1 hypothetical protein Q654_01527 [Bartonella henselae JK 50]ETS05875.1 hypothetical protein Q655_01474 [Bartonella henselae JK 51]ETS10831.1 hypothetical protein Q653_00552 [Bartonella henselae JK 42]ETS12921.1 hypothetical protein Q652_00682 [Bartonella henselae JK 41]